MTKIVIVAAKRTPIGSFMGSLKDVSAADLGVVAASAALSGVGDTVKADLAEVMVGCVLQAGQGMNVARQIGRGAGVPDSVPAMTVNRMCGSGLQAVVSAIQGLKAGDGQVYLAGGTESMSRAPYLLPRAREGYRLGHGELLDSILTDGLTDVFHRYHMGMTAENLAEKYDISREEQDAFALESQNRAAAALSGDFFRDLGLPEGFDPARDRAMLCGSMAMIKEAGELLETYGLKEGSNAEPADYVLERAFVG